MESEQWVGHRQGSLEIVSFEGIKVFGKGRAAYFKFRCDCGNEFVAQKSNVIGRKYDCGCSKPKSDRIAPPGASKNPLHKVWWHMIDRCENPHNRSYKDYGARGIKVCDRWKQGEDSATGFECFLSDMGPRPVGMTIERKDGRKGYSPDNCVWLPKAAQSKNRRGVWRVTIGSVTKTVPEWCEETGISYWTAIRRIQRGWPPIKAVTEPVKS